MGDFIVSARKYRPQTFDTVVGQKSITSTLKNAIKNEHLAQAFLFCGTRGVGKTTTARILAKTINCFNRTEETEACDNCDSCESFNSGASLNIYELDGASNNGVDHIRELTDQVRIAPQLGDFKVYIIDEVHQLSNFAFNAFLKTLEEPPKHAIFILATTEKHKIIPTILSRCQIFDFSRIKVKDITDHLVEIAKKENVKAEPEALHMIAMKADGALRDALSVFDQIVTFSENNITYQDVINNLHILDYDYFFKFTEFADKEDIPSCLLLFNEIIENGFDSHNFINGLSGHYRNLLVCKNPKSADLLEVPDGIKDKYLKQANEIDVNIIMRALNALSKADVSYKSAKNQRLLVEVCLMELCSLKQEQEKKKTLTDHIELLPIPEQSLRENKVPSRNKADIKSKTEKNPISKPETKLDAHSPSKEKTIDKPTLKTNVKEDHLSIKQILENEREVKTKKDVILPRDEVDTQKVLILWRQYAYITKDKGMETYYNALVKRDPIFESNEKIKIVVDNQIQVDVIRPLLNELINFLREKLNNHFIEIQIELSETPDEEVKFLNGKDKFDALVAKNPKLLTLKNLFNLDIEF